MARISYPKDYKVKKRIVKGICRLIENDVSCNSKARCRGVCGKHHTQLRKRGCMDKYAAPPKHLKFDTTTYKIKPKIVDGICRIIENKVPCGREFHGRGLCAKHWLLFKRKGQLKKYGGISRKDPVKLTLKKNPKKGECKQIQDGVPCDNASASGGLCPKHYLRLLRKKKKAKDAKRSTS